MNADKALESRMLPVERGCYVFNDSIFKNISTRTFFPLRRLDRKSEPREGETRFLMSCYNLPHARNFRSCRRKITPLAPRN